MHINSHTLPRKIILLLLVTAIVFVSGCKSSEDKLLSACIAKLENELQTWAKYDGWSTANVEATLYEMAPDNERNAKYKTDQFYAFEVLLSNFTVKNGFNAEIKSVSSCTGYVSKSSNGEYDPPEGYALDLTLNGNKLGL